MTNLDPLMPDDHLTGPSDAELELVMYGDFQCPYCIAAHPIVGRVRDRLGERLRFAFRHFPLHDIHPLAQLAAEAAEAAAAQERFWEMYELMYRSRGKLERTHLEGYAVELSLAREPFVAALDSGEYAGRVERDLRSGTASGITGTPAFFANGKRVDGAFDARSLIAALEG